LDDWTPKMIVSSCCCTAQGAKVRKSNLVVADVDAVTFYHRKYSFWYTLFANIADVAIAGI